jgi:hypothetical protein
MKARKIQRNAKIVLSDGKIIEIKIIKIWKANNYSFYLSLPKTLENKWEEIMKNNGKIDTVLEMLA